MTDNNALSIEEILRKQAMSEPADQRAARAGHYVAALSAVERLKHEREASPVEGQIR